MNKQKLISLFLIICGSFLEVLYYYNRYISEGTHNVVGLIQGAALTALLMGLFLIRSKWYIWLFIIPLAIYSIFNTSAGQRQALILKAESTIKNINNQQIETLEATKLRKIKAYESEAALKESSFESIQDRARWRTAAAVSDDILDSKDSDIDIIDAQILALRTVTIEESETAKLYKFYSDLTGISSKWIQLWLQFALSFFIAVMAPVGLILYPKDEDNTDWDFLIREFVHTNWVGIRTGQSRSILKKSDFLEFKHGKNIDFPSKSYDLIKKAAFTCNAVDKDGITDDNETSAINGMKKILER